MARNTIDFSKVDAAFQHLADSDEGNSALAKLRSALDAVGQLSEDLNEHEQHYLMTHLVQQREGGFGPNVKSAVGGARLSNGFLIKTAVD